MTGGELPESFGAGVDSQLIVQVLAGGFVERSEMTHTKDRLTAYIVSLYGYEPVGQRCHRVQSGHKEKCPRNRSQLPPPLLLLPFSTDRASHDD